MNYQKIYNSIIDRARQEKRRKKQGTYFEAHHIIPLCLGGEGKKSEWRNNPNIILLTAREHFICHWLLTRIHPSNTKLAYALWTMCNVKEEKQERYFPSSRVYEEARNGVIKVLKERRGTFTGRKHSEETKRKQSEAQKGKAKSKKHCENISKGLKGNIPWNKGKKKKLEV
jgi:NUMOD3 motif